MRVRDALPDSYERLFHHVGSRFLLCKADLKDSALAQELATERLHRAIGVVYKPRMERRSHYFRARLLDMYDAVIHVDRTQALEPLDRTQDWEREEVPETYPTGI
jgi:erythromycin esterase-like protein